MSFDLDAYRLHFSSIKIKELLGHRSKVQCLAWSKDGDKLVSGSSDGSIRVWFMDRIASSIASTKASSSNNTKISGNLSVETSHGSRNVNQIQFCPLDSNIFASASTDKNVKIWDISTNLHQEKPTKIPVNQFQEPRNILTISPESECLTISWHPLQPIIAVGTKDDRVLFYDLTGNEEKLLETIQFSNEVYDISWSSDGINIAVALGNGTVEIFKQLAERITVLKAHTADCFCIRFWGQDLLAAGSSDAQISLWSRDQSNNANFSCFRVLNRMEWPIRTISFNHDAEFLAVGSEDPFIAIEHIKTGALVAKISTGKPSSEARAGIPINSVTWHPNKNILAFASAEVDDRTGKATGSIKLFGI